MSYRAKVDLIAAQEDVASLRADLNKAVALLRPLADAADGYEDHAPVEQGCSGLTIGDARRARAFLKNHEAAQRAKEWKDIASAPRDGTWFLICREGEGFDSYEVGRHEPFTYPSFEYVEGDLYRRVEKQISEWRAFNNFHRATHWHALPQPPQEETEACDV